MSTARTGAFGEETPILDHTDELDVALYDADWNKVDASVTFNGDGTYSIVLPDEAGDYYLLGTNLIAKTTECVDAPAVAAVTVEQAEVPVTGITLDKSEINIEVGETETLTAAVEPEEATDKTVTWTSSDEEVAVVENGIVTAKKAGEAIITAAAGDFKAECKVIVTEQEAEGPSDGDGDGSEDESVISPDDDNEDGKTPEDKSASENKEGKAPKTGDNIPLLALAAMMIISICGAVAVFRRERRIS